MVVQSDKGTEPELGLGRGAHTRPPVCTRHALSGAEGRPVAQVDAAVFEARRTRAARCSRATWGRSRSTTVRACPERLSGRGVLHSESVLCGAFAWARSRVRNNPKRRFRGRAVAARHGGQHRLVWMFGFDGQVGPGRIVALYYRSSTLSHSH